MSIKQKKGISLIVLVITIIVMIILATAIILSLSSAGIIGKANKAVEDTDFKQLETAANVAYSEALLKGYTTKADIESQVRSSLLSNGYTEQDLAIYTIELGNNGIEVTKNSVEDSDLPEIPNGFTVSIYEGEKTVEEGLVIYKTDAATLNTKTQEEAQKAYDQFVWIPVDMTTFTRTEWSNNTPVEGLSTDYTEPSSYNGSTEYQYPTEVAEYNAMKASVEEHGGFYIARYEAGDGDVTEARTTYTTGAHTVVSRKGAYVYNYVGWGATMTDISSEIEDSSGNKKGAVYLSQNMYKEETSRNYTTNLIYGVQWDATLRWLSDKYNVTDSKSWGNYNNSTGEAATNSGYSNMNYMTGRNEAWKAKNIYDLAGNVGEWTLESHADDFRVYRGVQLIYGNLLGNPASRHSNSTISNFSCLGFRTVLYLN